MSATNNVISTSCTDREEGQLVSPQKMGESEEFMNMSERKLIQKKLGQRVRELRHNKQWSQEHFADLCNMHRGHMGQIERGESNLTLSSMVVLSSKLEIRLQELFKGIA